METFKQEVIMLCVNEIHDRYASDGWDFCDAVRSVTPPGVLLAQTVNNEVTDIQQQIEIKKL